MYNGFERDDGGTSATRTKQIGTATMSKPATDGSNVILNSSAAVGDVVSIVSFGTFLLADHYSKTAVDALIDDVETLALAGI